ncbi:MAG: cytochrome C oxidase subunit IV family protein [Chitinophagales bacterium]|nr:cytochrome C oxidase subunit IV family protein [Chitinophagales bacterium]
MEKSLKTTFISLLALTFFATGASFTATEGLVAIMIILFSVAKFLLVGLNFMELKEAHNFWKIVFIMYAFLISLAYMLLLK